MQGNGKMLGWQQVWFGTLMTYLENLQQPHPVSLSRCKYVFTPMLSGLRWPGQTVMGSSPPALPLWNKGWHTQQALKALHHNLGKHLETKSLRGRWKKTRAWVLQKGQETPDTTSSENPKEKKKKLDDGARERRCGTLGNLHLYENF